MIGGLIRGQSLRLSSPMIVADTIDYLTAQFVFQTGDWDGAVKYSHWKCGDITYDIPLENDRIDESAHLNLSAGVWSVYIHGEKYADGNLIQRITTCEATLTVKGTGTAGGLPFPEQPAGEIERIHAQIAELEDAKLSPIAKTDDMTQPVGRDDDGRLYTAPSSGAVKYTPQSLTDEQKKQARKNIGAISADEIKSGSVNVTYDDTTGELTITSAQDIIKYDPNTGELTIGG